MATLAYLNPYRIFCFSNIPKQKAVKTVAKRPVEAAKVEKTKKSGSDDSDSDSDSDSDDAIGELMT